MTPDEAIAIVKKRCPPEKIMSYGNGPLLEEVLVAEIERLRKRLETALAKRGVVVPAEATNKMICAALDAHDAGKRSYSDIWRAMVEAAQK